MRILFTRFPLESSLFGGAENQVMTLMMGLRAKGHDVVFLGSCPALLQRSKEAKIACYEHPQVPVPVTKLGCIQFFLHRQRIAHEIATHIRSTGPYDAVCMLSLPEKILTTDFALSLGLRVLWIEHDAIGRWLTWNPWRCRLQALSKSVTTICVSSLSRKLYSDIGFSEDCLRVIPNGIEAERFNSLLQIPPTVQRQDSEKGALLHVGCIARLSEEKGVHVLIDALALCSNVRCTILGNGPDRAHLQERVLDWKKRGKMLDVTFREYTEDIVQFYASLDALILPSIHHDPFGLVVAEAMLAGKATVVTDVCGIAQYVHLGEDAIIVRSDSASALADAIEKLKDPAVRNRLGDAGRKSARELFRADRMVDAYEEILLHA